MENNNPDPKAKSLRALMLEGVLEAQKFEYDDMLSACNQIEKKANQIATITGVLLAGAFAFTQTFGADTQPDIRILISVALFFLGVTLICVVFVMWPQGYKLPPTGASLSQRMSHMLKWMDDNPSTYLDFLSSINYTWSKANERNQEINKMKGVGLMLAFIALIISLVLVGVAAALWS